jgi:hypothetical protein
LRDKKGEERRGNGGRRLKRPKKAGTKVSAEEIKRTHQLSRYDPDSRVFKRRTQKIIPAAGSHMTFPRPCDST